MLQKQLLKWNSSVTEARVLIQFCPNFRVISKLSIVSKELKTIVFVPAQPGSICCTLRISAVPLLASRNTGSCEVRNILQWPSGPSQVDGSFNFKLLGGPFAGSLLKLASIDVRNEAVNLYGKNTVPFRDDWEVKNREAERRKPLRWRKVRVFTMLQLTPTSSWNRTVQCKKVINMQMVNGLNL